MSKLKTQDDVIKSYKKRWGIKDRENFHVSDTKNTKSFPDEIPIGETWTDRDGKVYKKIGNDSWVLKSEKKSFSISECGVCGKYMKSINEKNVHMETGKCFRCHAKRETVLIGRGEDYKAPEWKYEILFKDSYGNIVMDVNDMIKEYGNIVTHGVLQRVYESMGDINPDERNQELYTSIKKKIDQIEHEEGGEIDHEKVREEMLKVKEMISKRENETLKKKI